MSYQSYDKKSIALSQLETALRLFGEGREFFSVIALAGAAEEILGQVLTRQGRDNSLVSLKRAAVAIHEHLYGEPGDPQLIAKRANGPRNAIKHLNPNDPLTVSFDPHEEAVDMLTRAIDNYWLLESSLTLGMRQFERSQRGQ